METQQVETHNPRNTTKAQVSLNPYPTKYTYRVPHSVGKSTSIPAGLLAAMGMSGQTLGGDWSHFGKRGKRSEERARQALSRIVKRRNKRK